MSDAEKPSPAKEGAPEPKKEVPFGWLGTNNPMPQTRTPQVFEGRVEIATGEPRVITKIVEQPSLSYHAGIATREWVKVKIKSLRGNLRADTAFCRDAFRATLAEGWWGKVSAAVGHTNKWLNRLFGFGMFVGITWLYLRFIYPLVGNAGTVIVVLSLLVFAALVTIRVTRRFYDKTLGLLSKAQERNVNLESAVTSLSMEIDGLKAQIEAMKASAEDRPLWFEIDRGRATQVSACGWGSDGSRTFQVNVRLRCFKNSSSALAVRAIHAGLFLARGDGDVEIINREDSLLIMSDLGVEEIKTEDGWLIDKPMSPFRWYRFWFSIGGETLNLLSPDHFFRITMTAIGQVSQYVDFFVDSWENALKSGSGVTLRPESA